MESGLAAPRVCLVAALIAGLLSPFAIFAQEKIIRDVLSELGATIPVA